MYGDMPSTIKQGSSSELPCPEFLLGFRFVDMIDWIIDPEVALSFQPPFLPGLADTKWLKAPTL